jgi:hypothetical protein
MKRGVRESDQENSFLKLVVFKVKEQLYVLATLLQHKANQVSFTWQQGLLLLYCMLMAGLSIGVCYYSFHEKPSRSLHFTPIRSITPGVIYDLHPSLTSEEYQSIRLLRMRMDSMEASGNPIALGLRDTLFFLEHVFSIQNKK